MALRDIGAEALAGLLQRPGRIVLAMLGTILGTAAFVSILGITSTAGGQISRRFDLLQATQVTVKDAGAAHDAEAPLSFPPHAEAAASRIDGVVSSSVWWEVDMGDWKDTAVRRLLDPTISAGVNLSVVAATPGLFDAVDAAVKQGVRFNPFHEANALPVAVLGSTAASQLGVVSLADETVVFVDGTPMTVIGIMEHPRRLPQLNLAIILPSQTALARWGPPKQTRPAVMTVETRLGAGQVVAEQLAVAVRPDDPSVLEAVPPPDPRSLRTDVTAKINTLFLILASLTIVLGAVAIANSTLVAVIERTAEIGVRRTLGARPIHIALQFLIEAAAVGLVGGLIGASIGVLVTLATALAQNWTAVLEPWPVIVAPAGGAILGLLAGFYPAARAAIIEPAVALRR